MILSISILFYVNWY